MAAAPQRIILASASAARRQMLASSGLIFDVVPATIDEESLKVTLECQDPHPGSPEIAIALATAKAQSVSRTHPAGLVIGSDQVLSCDGVVYSKPADLQAARNQLQALRGKTHELHAAAALACAGQLMWTACRTARLSMRPFTEAFLEDYLARERDWVCQSVGAYRIEGPGIHLFDDISGDYFTILGMPLLDLLAELRRRGALAR